MSDEKVALPKPRPLSEFPNPSTQSYYGSLLAKQPEIALGVSVTIAHMAAVDAVHEQIIVSLLGAEGYSVNAVLKSVKSQHERTKLTLHLIDLKLERVHRELFNLINKQIAPIREIRNKFAHGLWGECQSIPGSLILGESKGWVDRLGRGLQIMASQSKTNRAKGFPELGSNCHQTEPRSVVATRRH